MPLMGRRATGDGRDGEATRDPRYDDMSAVVEMRRKRFARLGMHALHCSTGSIYQSLFQAYARRVP